MVKIFITGATGYIGGDALHVLATSHPEHEITALVRNSDKGALVAKDYPSVRLVYGDLDSSDLITEEAAKADIVVDAANADHEGAAHAIVKGLSSVATSTTSKFYIHVSGTGILTIDDTSDNRYGQPLEKVYDDWKEIYAVTHMRDDALHRNVDKVVLAAGEKDGIKTAIVCPPVIYGPGRGPGNQRSVQAPELARATIDLGHAVVVGEGQNRWSTVHVQDLSNIFVRLIEEAAKGGGEATWSDEGYYFAEHVEYVWKDVAQAVAKEAKKQDLIKNDDVQSVTPAEADKITHAGAILWGTNARSRAIRARKVLGWEPKQKKLIEEVPDIVAAEAKSIGRVLGHREVAAGNP